MAGIRPSPGGSVRERGVQSRRVRESQESARRPAPTSSGANTWQIIAIIALLAATAGWTTVARHRAPRTGPAPAAVADPTDNADPADLEEEEASEEPVVIPHDAPELEAVLPTAVNGVTLATKSAAGEDLITDGRLRRRPQDLPDERRQDTGRPALGPGDRRAGNARRRLQCLARRGRRWRQGEGHADRGLEGRLPGPQGDRRHHRRRAREVGPIRYGDAAQLPVRARRALLRHLDGRPEHRRRRRSPRCRRRACRARPLPPAPSAAPAASASAAP